MTMKYEDVCSTMGCSAANSNGCPSCFRCFPSAGVDLKCVFNALRQKHFPKQATVHGITTQWAFFQHKPNRIKTLCALRPKFRVVLKLELASFDEHPIALGHHRAGLAL